MSKTPKDNTDMEAHFAQAEKEKHIQKPIAMYRVDNPHSDKKTLLSYSKQGGDKIYVTAEGAKEYTKRAFILAGFPPDAPLYFMGKKEKEEEIPSDLDERTVVSTWLGQELQTEEYFRSHGVPENIQIVCLGEGEIGKISFGEHSGFEVVWDGYLFWAMDGPRRIMKMESLLGINGLIETMKRTTFID
jgi:hypothetical protein